MSNVDPAEIEKFNAVAAHWWDMHGEFKPLHDINPLRLSYIIERCAGLAGKKVLDVGCGGGILSESMAASGADVTGIDLSPEALHVARQHLNESGHSIDYRQVPAEQLAETLPEQFDVVTCMEMLEHVPDPGAVIAACARLVKPGGHVVFSTINRNPKAFLFAIVGAEYVLNLVPRGTHEYQKFIRPSELAEWVETAGLQRHHTTGLHYNPLSKHYWLADNVDVNYLMHTSKA
ncbi:MAG: bifunctional 3-demethylubiquinol 3-O-methyltransferase/2-polyprenyl-6-hydroxyphenol methylase [Gammaproteobacteria bacterium]|nr:MAG: bifunctional 3-demethylubiquinol 3-O-methyltransferase/2-polyprenyl-6-hydroxyphenol methylase [Gammaproteobacteria bacterium]